MFRDFFDGREGDRVTQSRDTINAYHMLYKINGIVDEEGEPVERKREGWNATFSNGVELRQFINVLIRGTQGERNITE